MRDVTATPLRERNDPRQYDDLATSWWDTRGPFAMLHWIAEARARHLPTPRPGARLLDVACGGGLLAKHTSGYAHVGVDLQRPGLQQARAHGVAVVQADATRLPFADASFDVVVAGEVLEHVRDPWTVVREACRVLAPGGTLVVDTIASTWWGRFSAITMAERLPAGPPPRLHDGALFIDRHQLVATAAAAGVPLRLFGLRPSALDYVRWLAGRRADVRMVPVRSTAGLFQAVGVKA
ncbi:MAG: 2-polyprenyl-6-hydroxyphenyl methylase / 3-demethylubiquinone-9 3-methyltransferase [Frankiales bacterium]|nr:2-polyprenyl-6-hydroxyphenyl methylase / 3-demethylubiquinone-9 3-methyltransferase [Frankiales bacterium]